MPKIGPTRTIKELQASARHTYHGKGRRGLPGVKTDSKVVDRNAHAQNGELGKRISRAVHSLKKSDKNGDRTSVASLVTKRPSPFTL